MIAKKHREEHANTLLALILQGLGIEADAETKGHPSHKKPDFIIQSSGKTIIMEAEYGNTSGAEKDADERLIQDGLHPNIIGAISYSPAFEEDFKKALLSHETLDFAFKSASIGKGHWDGRWRTGTVYDLAQVLRRPNALTKMPQDETKLAVTTISAALEQFSEQFHDRPADCERIAEILQASLPIAGDERKKAITQSVRLGGLILIGAFMFQFALASRVKGVESPSIYEQPKYNLSDIGAHWQHILDKINYAAIFKIALKVLIYGNVHRRDALITLEAAKNVQDVARDGADVMGEVYHKLLAELAKPLGAYYTTIPAATMLSALALPLSQNKEIEWDNPEKISKLRIADLACGSGTLLAAICGQVRDNAMRRHVEKIIDNKSIPMGNDDLVNKTHATLMEKVVWGFDVLDAASHLTATTLGLMSPEVDFRKSHIYRAAIGKNKDGYGAAGSFNLFDSNQITRVLFDSEKGKEAGIEHAETGEDFSDPLPQLDLCIMNPPFVVGRKDAISYSFLSKSDAVAVRKTMNELSNRYGFHMGYGMGPGFIALAERYVKAGGCIAMIISSTLANGHGKAWINARKCIENSCDLEHIIVSHEPGQVNFSSSTNMQECMFIARKRLDGEKSAERAMFSVLTKNPQDANSAHATTKAILDAKDSGKKFGDLKIHNHKIGEFALLRYRKMPWNGLAFTNLRLTMAANMFVEKGQITPYSSGKSAIPICHLETLANFGSHHLHCHTNDPVIKQKTRRRLAFSETPTQYAGYYPGHHKRKTGIGQQDIDSMLEDPNCYFLPLTEDDQNWTDNYFAWGGKIAINSSFRFNTSRRLVTLLNTPIQGANYMPVRLKHETKQRAKVMVLWLNSTLCVMMMAARAVNCQGAKVMLSTESAKILPVLNLNELSPEQIRDLAKSFDKIAKMQFRQIPEMTEDPTRIAIDNALSKTLDLHDFDFNALRHALVAEPIINGKFTTAK